MRDTLQDSKDTGTVVRRLTRERVRSAPTTLRPLGILVSEKSEYAAKGTAAPFAEAEYVRRLAAAAPRHGLQAHAFDPASWDADTNTVKGWRWTAGGWLQETVPAPALLYDRLWPDGPGARERSMAGLRAMRERGGFKLLNGSLPGKTAVLRALSRWPDIRPLLPPSAAYRGIASLSAWVRSQGGAFLKPSGGSQGKGALAISAAADGCWTLSGRDTAGRLLRPRRLPRPDAVRIVREWIGGRTYLMQPLLDLRGAGGEPFDLRALMQKDGGGTWRLTGVAVRTGAPESVTANLHGGGVARPPEPYLAGLFGERAAARLLASVRAACDSVVARLEQLYGRFAELGLDYGIDRAGRIWFLEANTKPGRASMAEAGGDAKSDAINNPLAYARYILLVSSGRVCHEFDLVQRSLHAAGGEGHMAVQPARQDAEYRRPQDD
ncbi:YheC/YheD family endospore coat-associated protein [Cohnella sp. 56]|uniref:YheC/YheD family endospore coat-associated protein n=1 Tax=Cohnella sp. 56 TaxID=3113722 RepID=UPI0030E7D7D0